jgi:hypothetical protein
MVMAEYINLSKRACENYSVGSSSSRSSVSPEVAIIPGTIILLECNYLGIKYWKKETWKVHKKKLRDSLKISNQQSGSWGGVRSAQGNNIMMQYLEEVNGTMVNGNKAGNIQEHTCTIWRGFYTKGIVPVRWGEGSKELQDQYCSEMESQFPILCYCDNHWKAHTIMTTIYSQWYHSWDEKMGGIIKVEGLNKDLKDEPAPK